MHLSKTSQIIIGIIVFLLAIAIGILYPEIVDAQESDWQTAYEFQQGRTNTDIWTVYSPAGAGQPRMRYVDRAWQDIAGVDWFEASFTAATIDNLPSFRIGLVGRQAKRENKETSDIQSQVSLVLGYLGRQQLSTDFWLEIDGELRTSINTLDLGLYLHRLALVKQTKSMLYGLTNTAKINQDSSYLAPGITVGWQKEPYGLNIDYYLASQVDWRIGATYAF